ncbi:MAG: hypothetical protein LBE18_06065 [Planctomycetaceae bacterium]|nr:hypothetical protein [Planctomycetaceae bacterium]
MNGIKKSAKFLSSLDWNTTSRLLDCLDSETAGMLRQEIMSIGNVSLEESDQLANEFLKSAGHKPQQNKNKFVTETLEISSGTYGIHQSRIANNFNKLTHTNNTSTFNSVPDNSNLRFTFNPNIGQTNQSKPDVQLYDQTDNQTDYRTNDRTHDQTKDRTDYLTDYQTDLYKNRADIYSRENKQNKLPFEFLFEEPSVKIAEAICCEHPQTIAVVIAALPDSLAVETLSVFPPVLQQEVGKRLAEIKLSGFDLTNNPILLEIESELKQRFNKQYGISFDDLNKLDDSTLINLFRAVDIKTAMFALAGANPNFIKRITQKFTTTEESIMRKLLNETKTINEKDVNTARTILINKAAQLL